MIQTRHSFVTNANVSNEFITTAMQRSDATNLIIIKFKCSVIKIGLYSTAVVLYTYIFDAWNFLLRK